MDEGLAGWLWQAAEAATVSDYRATWHIAGLTELAREIAAARGVTVAELRAKGRANSQPRQEFMWRAHQAGFSYPQIGRYLSGRHHTTIMYGAGRYLERLI